MKLMYFVNIAVLCCLLSILIGQSHLLSLLLYLEFMVLTRVFMVLVIGTLHLILLLIIIGVGEACLGLSLLVKLSRCQGPEKVSIARLLG